jgi:O-antigen/teichoic acid export membrane protein
VPNIRRSLVLSFAQNYTGMLITVPSIMILARFLTPAETGIFSVAMAVTNLAHVLRDFGVGGYLIQEREITREKIRAAFTIALATAWTVALLLFLISPFAADFYKEPGVGSVLNVLALNFVLIPLGAPALTLLRREMAYGVLYVINTVSAVARSATSITMAILGFSYMALAWGSLAGVAASTIMVSFYRSSDTWLLPGLSEWRSVLAFGSKKTMIDIMLELNNSANNIVVGRMLGFAATGLLSRGQGLIRLFQSKILSSIKSVAFPAFASYYRSGKGINAFYTKGVCYITAIAWPFYAFAAIMAYPIIHAAFGQQWLPAAPILRILAAAVAIRTLNFSLGQAYMASGHINNYLKITYVTQPIRLGLLVWAAFYNIEAVAGVAVAVSVISLALNYRETAKLYNLHFRDVARATYRSAGITVISSVIPLLVYALHVTGELTNPWVVLIVGGAGGALGWLIGVFATHHPITEEVGLLRSWLGKRRYFAFCGKSG